ncbi:hypothetical protein CVT26_009128 [Gymnopilus dilepis]|uniref:F-box domain-containing protein n=1 Tax=Gymnopilus dilepis TaxID=231916 RepID=A0A409YRG9_9AGAR|nr:hypothetical protein CVT26_009128 [Gymnopilus dilepis]
MELLSLSGQLPLDIRLFYEGKGGCPEEEDVEVFRPFAQYLNKCSLRWHTLVLDLASPFLELIQEEETPNGMHCLSVRCTGGSCYLLDITRSAPTQLLLNRGVILGRDLQWGKMTVFHAERFCLEEIIRILEAAPHVECCRLDQVSFRWPWDPSQQCVTPLALTDLDINFSSSDAARHFFNHFTLPSLTSFRSNFTSWQFADTSFIPFLQRSNCSFKLLELRHVEVDNTDVLELLRYATPSLRSLCISVEAATDGTRQCSLIDNLNELFSAHLTLDDSCRRPVSVEPILPYLTTFKLSMDAVWAVIYNRQKERKVIPPKLDKLIPGLFAPSARNEHLPLRPLHLVEIICGPFERTEAELPLLNKDSLDYISQLRRGGIEIDLKALIWKGCHEISATDLCELSQEVEGEGSDVERV